MALSFDSALNTWIYRIGLNKAKNDAIAQGRRISEVDMSDALAETVEERVAGKTLTPEQELQNKQLGSRLQEAMDSISPEHRAAFEMRELQGMEYEAIAQELGVPIGTVRSRISRAKDALQGFLKGERGRADIGMTELCADRPEFNSRQAHGGGKPVAKSMTVDSLLDSSFFRQSGDRQAHGFVRNRSPERMA